MKINNRQNDNMECNIIGEPPDQKKELGKRKGSENKNNRICRSKPLKNLQSGLRIHGVEVSEQEGMAHGESSEHRERVESRAEA